ncbi:hypothetical protein CWI38_1015p0010 [Hamiltosporidium tvaerminnensis]|uniref:Uncharacterized protein n=1 Tax=Hamiltosporidium tvaerminnensis TaxID=1176355 RepID=A0A4Q9LTL0_9MICR|nr:hypothetical protein CWI38_1015p0010 [Hamiltosporidium tvaerminnensis]
MQEKFVALHPNPVTHHPTDSHFSKNQGTILDQGEAKTCLRVESTHKKPYSSYKIDDGSNFGDNSSFSTPEGVSHKISKNNNAPCLVYSHFISIDSPPEKLSSLELKNLLNHISNYSENMAIPDISIILDIDVLFDDILKEGIFAKYFLLARNLLIIEKNIINIDAIKKKEFEDLFKKNGKNMDLAVPETSIFYNIPLLFHLHKLLEVEIYSCTPHVKYYVRIAFCLKLVKSILIKTSEMIADILDPSKSTYIENIYFDRNFHKNFRIYNNLTVIIKIFTIICVNKSEILQGYLELFSAARECYKAKLPNNSCSEKNVFTDKNIWYLFDVMFRYEYFDISEIQFCSCIINPISGASNPSEAL